jgi:hypothetical protein
LATTIVMSWNCLAIKPGVRKATLTRKTAARGAPPSLFSSSVA